MTPYVQLREKDGLEPETFSSYRNESNFLFVLKIFERHVRQSVKPLCQQI